MACSLWMKNKVQSKVVLSSFAAIHTEVYTLRNAQEISRHALINTELQCEAIGGAM